MNTVITLDLHREGESLGSPMVIDYPDVATGRATLARKDVGDEQVTTSGKICILFDYPLANPVTLEFETTGTIKGFAAVHLPGLHQHLRSRSGPWLHPRHGQSGAKHRPLRYLRPLYFSALCGKNHTNRAIILRIDDRIVNGS
jgi:hypothetical protein